MDDTSHWSLVAARLMGLDVVVLSTMVVLMLIMVKPTRRTCDVALSLGVSSEDEELDAEDVEEWTEAEQRVTRGAVFYLGVVWFGVMCAGTTA